MLSALQQVAQAGGPELLQRLKRLDAAHAAPPRAVLRSDGPHHGAAVDYDVLLLGGGLSLLYAPLLAAQGWRVAVVEQHRAGTAQREWNASWQELQVLPQLGLLSHTALPQLLLARYTHGVCRWFGGDSHAVTGVLDCAVDATALLGLARDQCLRQGVHLYSGHCCTALAVGNGGVRVEMQQGSLQMPSSRPSTYRTARLVLDGRGFQSPYAQADLLCPTVGGVLEDIDFAAQVGDILVTTEDSEDGRQYIWEAFPGRAGQLTVYLFYYSERQRMPPAALQALYTRFFARLPTFKPGRARLIRPTFGYIPGWSRLTAPPRAPHPRIVLLGDAAARQSPLTFCGFGATLRSLQPVSQAIRAFLQHDANNTALGMRPIQVDDRSIHSATGALAMLMARPPREAPAALNTLLNAAFASLAALGNATYAALLQDRLSLQQFVQFLRATQPRYPQAWRLMAQTLGYPLMLRWGWQLALGLLRERATQLLPAAFDVATPKAPKTSHKALSRGDDAHNVHS